MDPLSQLRQLQNQPQSKTPAQEIEQLENEVKECSKERIFLIEEINKKKRALKLEDITTQRRLGFLLNKSLRANERIKAIQFTMIGKK